MSSEQQENMHEQPGGEQPGFEPPLEDIVKGNSDDGVLATIILGAAIALVLIGGILYRNWTSKKGGDGDDVLLWETDATTGAAVDATSGDFTPPVERQAYINARASLSIDNKENVPTLKKKLMLRALKTIPLLYELQNGGPSVDRLYKKGMLTDSMHNRFKELKAFIDAEFAEVQEEAEALFPGWGGVIWPQANQYYQIQSKAAAGGDAGGMNTLGGDGGEDGEDDDGESIIASLSSSSTAVKAGGPAISSTSPSSSAGSAMKEDGEARRVTPYVSKKEKDLSGMTDAEKADYFAKELLAEEQRQGSNRKGNRKAGSKK